MLAAEDPKLCIRCRKGTDIPAECGVELGKCVS